MFIMQWCFPFLRQQAGRRASPSAVPAKSGAATGRPKTTSNKMDSSFLNGLIEAHPEFLGKSGGSSHGLIDRGLINMIWLTSESFLEQHASRMRGMFASY
jgi:hypothetical protein